LRQDLVSLVRELPSLANLALSDDSAMHRLQAIASDESRSHDIETFVAVQWDLAAAEGADEAVGPEDRRCARARMAMAAASLFAHRGLGHYVLED
jgi:hypothetical protein